MDFPIDCQTFLRLAGEKLGPSTSELYIIEPSGIRLWDEGFANGDFASRWGRASTDAKLLDRADQARLPFPTTARVVAAWHPQNSEFTLPPWFFSVVKSEKLDVAVAELERIAKGHKGEHDTTARKLTKVKMARGKPTEWYPIEQELNRIQDLRYVVDNVLAHLRTSDSALTPLSEVNAAAPKWRFRPRRRLDALAIEIREAILRVGCEVDDVWMELKRHVGAPGSCIIDQGVGVLVWRGTTGGKQSLRKKGLSQRIDGLIERSAG